MHNFSKLSPIYHQGDIKYYWRVHCDRMQMMHQKPVTYARFWDRLKRGWILYDAIYTPCTKKSVTKQTSLTTNPRREFVMAHMGGDDMIQIKTLDELLEMNKIQMPKPKPTLWQRIKKIFKRRA